MRIDYALEIFVVVTQKKFDLLLSIIIFFFNIQNDWHVVVVLRYKLGFQLVVVVSECGSGLFE